MENEKITCHGCGVAVSSNISQCEYCGNPIQIRSFRSVAGMSPQLLNKYIQSYQKDLSAQPNNSDSKIAIAFCYLQLKLYDKAIEVFIKEAESNLNNSEVLFYAAISLLKGKKAFLAQRTDIDKMLEYLVAATIIEDKPIFRYVLAYIKYDFFHRKGYKINPNYEHEYKAALDGGVTDLDIKELHELLSVERPVVFG
ncbi:MAG: hypothetical protein M0T74_01440 [Desulfitobacterium hafniense]|nr:hypothetical protein [Desulfitobacterium hafniense]